MPNFAPKFVTLLCNYTSHEKTFMFSLLAGLCHEQNIYVLIHFSYLPETIIRDAWKVIQENCCRNKYNDRFRIQSDDIRTVTTRKTRVLATRETQLSANQRACLTSTSRHSTSRLVFSVARKWEIIATSIRRRPFDPAELSVFCRNKPLSEAEYQ